MLRLLYYIWRLFDTYNWLIKSINSQAFAAINVNLLHVCINGGT